MKIQTTFAALAGVAVSGFVAQAALADEVDFLCYQDLNECEVIESMAAEFTAATGHTVKVTTVGYDIVRDQLENQLQTDAAPDVVIAVRKDKRHRPASAISQFPE